MGSSAHRTRNHSATSDALERHEAFNPLHDSLNRRPSLLPHRYPSLPDHLPGEEDILPAGLGLAHLEADHERALVLRLGEIEGGLVVDAGGEAGLEGGEGLPARGRAAA